jgi:hypothetical protein
MIAGTEDCDIEAGEHQDAGVMKLDGPDEF